MKAQLQRRITISILAMILAVIAPAANACIEILMDIDITVVCVYYTGGSACWVTYWEYYGCWDPGGGGNPPPPPPVPEPPPPPEIRIVSMNDSNPGNPVLSIETANVHHIELYIDGSMQNTYDGATSSIILPTLDPTGTFRRNSIVELRAFNSWGILASANLSIDRPSGIASSRAGMYVRYYETGPGGIVLENQVNMTRSLSTFIINTNYSCATAGARNGRVFHWGSEDVIGWDGLRPDPAWTASYHMTSLPYPQSWEENPCTARFTTGPANQSGQCSSPKSFAVDGSPGATAAITTFGMGDFLDYQTFIIPNEINLNPDNQW